MALEIRRIYEDDPKRRLDKGGESFRIFVDRLWARGINKKEASIDLWLKDIAPSDMLRRWFGHDPRKWNEFKERYFKELDGKNESVELILQKLHAGSSVILLYGAKAENFNNAAALKEYLCNKLAK
ncbi:MAG: DUF488 family protein [Thermoproteota archaeon]|nr:DUF488 family protein [Thermoproteota archaeon]